jgi:hypothetical protein
MVMVKGMKRRDVERALLAQNCRSLRNKGGHEIWGCPCGQHTYALPNHAVTSPGVVRKATQDLACLERGWLQ